MSELDQLKVQLAAAKAEVGDLRHQVAMLTDPDVPNVLVSEAIQRRDKYWRDQLKPVVGFVNAILEVVDLLENSDNQHWTIYCKLILAHLRQLILPRSEIESLTKNKKAQK